MKKILSGIAITAAVTMLSLNLGAQEIGNISRASTKSPEINGNKITFRLSANYATQVKLSGSWMTNAFAGGEMMKKSDNGIWEITIDAPAPELYTYTFTVDGVSTLDPSNVFVQRDGSRYMNGLLVEGGYADEYKEAEHHGNIEQAWYYSAENNMERRLYVYVPYGYDKNDKKTKYPVLYLLHGGGGDEDAWSTLGRTAQIMDNLIAAGKAVPMLVVMPNGNPNQYAAQTLGIPTNPNTKSYNSGFDNYTSLVNDIVPFIEKNYKVKADRAHRSVAGLSMGGGQSFYIAFRNTDKFASVGIFSSGLIGASAIGSAPFDGEKEMPGIYNTPSKYNKFDLIYLSCGEQDNRITGMKEFYDKLNSLGYKGLFYESYPGNHEWKVWRRNLSSYVQKIFK